MRRKKFVAGALGACALVMGVAPAASGYVGEQLPDTARQPAGAAYRGGDAASATLKDAKGNEVGSAWFTTDSRAHSVWVEVYLTGHFPPGFHGMHVHEKGNCTVGDPTNPFTAAGGHLMPMDHHTGLPIGQLPPVQVRSNGRGYIKFVLDTFTLDQLFGPAGTAIIVHSKPDNFANIPADRYSVRGDPNAPVPDEKTTATGDAGSRFACGVITRDQN
ncbi:superoxide dismutase family protein [Amycolatopsis rubida]|uniref:Superoxide dismutase [Cu-Zn] n=1 Tax=Amycolatopsis rubida TaxID=112413 RepID=A0ABX0BWV5_9PSEU|nr:superoxide dismutase family protein [Amycolatopsis sp. M39]MYW93647.1 superoxide dismutase [Amycolatopsis rubida]NEC58634.1 superoxide dismutase family protein [Amycolatopsis rubida]OAP21448.1 Superoxide dismutase [Cu-Zn] precursor [Amycolatopsis sp. M39]